MNERIVLRAILAIAATLLMSAAAHAQAFRTYLSGGGSDSNPCSLVAPCRLLPAAIAAVGSGGEIWMLDSANYNTSPVNVNKSVTILAVPGALGSVVALGGNAINIGTAGVKVALRNLVIVPFAGGGGVNGIVMSAGASLTVEKCLIANLPADGINVNANAASVLVTDTAIRSNGGSGLLVAGGARATVTRATISGNANSGVYVLGNGSGTTTADIADSTLGANWDGVRGHSTGTPVKASVRDSQLVGNGQAGAIAQSGGASVTLSVSSNVVSNNAFGIVANGAGTKVWATGNTVSDNGTGLHNDPPALFESATDNAVRNNTIPTTGTITPISKM
jgi:parallel beta helix pectate lyase-like protein